MKLNKLLFFVPIILLVISCSGGSSGGGSETSTVTLSSITVTPVNPSIALGATEQFIAMGILSDSTTQVLTALATWSSSDTSVATISNAAGSNGLVTSLAAGTAIITVSLSGVSNTMQLTVTSTPLDNVLAVTVNGSLCSSNSYPNKPCVSVTVCSPGTSTCQTINDILLDTGSSGLRIFKSLLTGVSLTQVASGSGSLTECIQYADGSADWGPVQTVDVILGGEAAVRVPIQIIDSTFGTVPKSCGTPDTTPEASGYNGILGVGLFTEDCGSRCVNIINNGYYYSCSGSTCTATKAPIADQVQNPVSHLPIDNNGVIVQLPSVSLGGTTSVNGILILGIGTQSNNKPSGVTMYPADPTYGEFTTVFNGRTYSDSFIDSGSNALFFNKSSVSALTICTSGIASGWFCPSSTQNLSATTTGSMGSPSGTVSFQIGNASSLLSSSYNVFSELGAPDTSFDWGLPFHLGRSVYVGIDGTTSSLGTGPYWAY
jgi:hypothetical protein